MMALIVVNYHEFSSIVVSLRTDQPLGLLCHRSVGIQCSDNPCWSSVTHLFDVDRLMSRFSDLDRKFIVSDFHGCCFFSLHYANVNFLPDRAELTAVGLSG